MSSVLHLASAFNFLPVMPLVSWNNERWQGCGRYKRRTHLSNWCYCRYKTHNIPTLTSKKRINQVHKTKHHHANTEFHQSTSNRVKSGRYEQKFITYKPGPQKFPIFHRNLMTWFCTLLVVKGRSKLDWNKLEKFHLQKGAALKNSRIETH
jgi:hypothetical protein